jgi:hypothetical protein
LTVHVALETRVGSGDVTLFQGLRPDEDEFIIILGAESVVLDENAGRGAPVDAAPVDCANAYLLEDMTPLSSVKDRGPDDEVGTKRLIDVSTEGRVAEAVTLE